MRLVAEVLLACGLALMACSPSQGTIGAVIGQRQDGRLFLREVPKDLAAHRAGLREGDEILLIDGRDVRTMTSKQLHQTLSGEVGAKVKLTLVRANQVVRATVNRTPARKLRAKRLSAD
jgi:C-terminal processing protease CtpA/Prc